MNSVNIKKIALRIHIGLISIIFFNFIIRSFLDINLIANVVFVLKCLFYISGVLLFFLCLRPFSKWAIYFSLYLISPIGIMISWLADGILGAILGSFFIFFFQEPSQIRVDGNYKLCNQVAGLMGACCKYSIYEDKLFFFEEKVGEFKCEQSESDIRKFSVDALKNEAYIKFNFDNYNPTDSVLIVKLK